MRISILAALAAAVVASPSAVLAQAKPIVIKFSHVDGPDSIRGNGALKFKEQAEKLTGGKVKVEVYPNGTLASDAAEMEALQKGSVQMLAPSTTKLKALGVKEFEVLELPYLFPNEQVFTSIVTTNSSVGRSLFKALEVKGITGLAYWSSGFQVISSNQPVKVPGDMKSSLIRVSSKVADEYFRGLGARPQVVASSDVAKALQDGVIAGMEDTPSNIYSQNLHLAQRYIAVTNHAHLQYAVVVDKKLWDGLPADIRTQLANAMGAATSYVNSVAKSKQETALAAIKASGKSTVQDLTTAQREEWKKAMQATDKAAKNRIGREAYDLIVNDLMVQGYKL